MNRIIRINMERREISERRIRPSYRFLGGRALTSRMLFDEIMPSCNPLGKRNKCVIATGLFAGTALPCSGRLSIGAKSPLTRGIKESNVGGTAAWKMSRLGIKAIVIEGLPAEGEGVSIVRLSRQENEILNGSEYSKKGTYELAEELRRRFGNNVGLIMIGPAGEMMLSAAGVAVTDMDGTPCNYAGRGGMGAVLGSKKIKAIILDDKGPSNQKQYRDKAEFLRICKELTKSLKKDKSALREYGTPLEVKLSNEMGYLPTRNYSAGRFEGVDKISGETMCQTIRERGGNSGKPCMPGCPIHCKQTYLDIKGDPITSGFEYETIVMMGSNCGIDDLDGIARMSKICDDLGIDTIEMGAAVAVAMEAGIIPFGDSEAAISMLNSIYDGTTIGRVIGNGAEITGRVFGVRRVPTVKGQSLAAYDPRGNKGIGVTYMSSPMGADHTAGCVMPGRKGFDASKDYDMLQSKGQEELSLDLQITVAVYDALGLCFFIGLGPEELKTIAKLHHARYGSNVTFEALVDMGRDLLKNEHEFNLAAGIHPVSSLPEFFELEELSPHQTRFDVDRDVVKRHVKKELSLSTED